MIRALLTLNGNNSDRQALRDGGIKGIRCRGVVGQTGHVATADAGERPARATRR
jgi:hypothetical protein